MRRAGVRLRDLQENILYKKASRKIKKFYKKQHVAMEIYVISGYIFHCKNSLLD